MIREPELFLAADVASEDADHKPTRGCRNDVDLYEDQLVALVHLQTPMSRWWTDTISPSVSGA
ncbi:hypothetical protein [Catenulispora yoronensis]|uniref:hypothetical protein n=1 Tax=Catenulispora yoronensis TaxID=450799 RepID=UPI0031D70DC9